MKESVCLYCSHIASHISTFQDLQTASSFFCLFIIALFFSSILKLILAQNGDVEGNTGLRRLNEIVSHVATGNGLISRKLLKLSQIEAYNFIYKYDICISEKYSYLSISVDDKGIQSVGYNLIRADH